MNESLQPPLAERPVTYVASVDALAAVCAHLSTVDRFALDTEFVGERTYAPQLELIQVATSSQFALIDCQAVTDLDGFLAVLFDPRIEKVVHAGQQDIELFNALSGRALTPVFDTQVAAAMAGYGAQPGYAHLVERMLGVTLEKTETLTDWSRRPLTRAQIAYAVDDVRYLLPLYDGLRDCMLKLHRWEWLQEELRRVETAVRSEPIDPQRAFLRVRGRGALRAKGLVVLRELAAWREEVASQRNKPRGSILRDEALVEIARKAPTTVAALQGLRAVRSRELDKQADAVVERIGRALELPKDQWPQPAPSHGAVLPPGLVELMQAVLRARAEEAHVAPNLLATHAELELLVQRHLAGDAGTLPVLQGWRRKIAGDDLLALLEGRAAVEIDPKVHRIRLRDGARPKSAKGA